jgi:LmbE family N-acetylglucosaminyl deacetylase
MILGYGPTLILAAHPDDEVLGAGGWMARYRNTVSIAIVSEGTSANGDAIGSPTYEERLALKRQATHFVAKSFGHGVVWEGTYPVLQLHKAGIDLIDKVTRIVQQVRPTVILTHNPTDLNQDHRVVAEAALIASRGYSDAGQSVQLVLGFTVDPIAAPSLAGQAGANFFLALTEEQLQAKLAACAAYTTEMRPWPHPRSVEALEALARWSGARIGRTAAEPYTVLWGCQ